MSRAVVVVEKVRIKRKEASRGRLGAILFVVPGRVGVMMREG